MSHRVLEMEMTIATILTVDPAAVTIVIAVAQEMATTEIVDRTAMTIALKTIASRVVEEIIPTIVTAAPEGVMVNGTKDEGLGTIPIEKLQMYWAGDKLLYNKFGTSLPD